MNRYIGCNQAAMNAAAAIIAFVLLASCANTSDSKLSSGAPASSEEIIAGLQIVDCLLPGQLRKLGNMTYLSPRRPIKTTAADCNVRGGEYVAYDRADYKTALKIWLPTAEQGDAEAQLAVGEIFEKGLGAEPNYEAAVLWYQKAAAQGNKSAQFNLGTMYEQGLGVAQNKLQALNLYREAWGMPADSVIFQDAARSEQQALRKALEAQLSAKNDQLALMERQLASLKKKTASKQPSDSAPVTELATLTQIVASLQNDRASVEKQLSTIPRLRTPAASLNATPAQAATAAEIKVADMDFGRYYALIIGNRNYTQLEHLETPLNDAREVGEILEKQYGFQVQLLLDSDRLTVMKAINELHSVLGENDNLLIYYAGHGSMINVGERDTGYWLPINADPPPNDASWVSNDFVSNHLGRIQAKRVLVIADSCYGGLLSSAPGHLFFGQTTGAGSSDYIKYKLPRRSRLLLSSGGDKPVIDEGGRGHSVFAQELIDTLRSNVGVLSAPDLYASIRGPVKARAAVNQFVQEPVYKSIKGAGHEVGDFFFVPKALSQ
ncbi:MAG: caspase family protein [Zhongshania sp.]|uniref:caspase family protein n=1 Tax=Zhongshania sp. TaxID=1971902 RepID=UPI0026227108|nr:caspase family protein [Zhongshania sp.]MDF1691083.1 caspase family protein [Zhongshania sp.]